MAVFNGTNSNDSLNGTADADTLIGGLGDDSYVVNNAGDVVTENEDEGTDRVVSSLTFTLGNNIENLILSGVSDINGIGNALNNLIAGGKGNAAAGKKVFDLF